MNISCEKTRRAIPHARPSTGMFPTTSDVSPTQPQCFPMVSLLDMGFQLSGFQ